MDHRDDRRAEELESLGLELATFALRLDAFEARLKGGSAKMSGYSTKPITPVNQAATPHSKDDSQFGDAEN